MSLNVRTGFAALFVLGGLAAAAPASAHVQFAVFNPVPSKSGGVVNFKDDGQGHLQSVKAVTPTIFMFDLKPLSNFGNLNSNFDFFATQTGPAASAHGLIAASFNGYFDFYYSGKTMSKGGVTLTKGELLLHGSFKNATFLGRAFASGGALTDDSLVGTVTYTSAIPYSVLPLAHNGQSFTLGFIEMSPVLSIQTKGKYAGDLRNFQAIGDGKFSSNVPEPATWALMLGGLGAVGLAARRRTRLAASVA